MSTPNTRPAEGIEARHKKACRSHVGSRCDCTPSYHATVGDARKGTRVKRTLPALAAAKSWRRDALIALRNGTLAEARPKLTVREACAAWEADARRGVVTTRSGASTSRERSAPTRSPCGCACSTTSATSSSTRSGGATCRTSLPAVRSRRERFATPAEAEALLAALSDADRPVWATAVYAGLRRGELMGLRWEDVDLPAGRIAVRWGWDVEHGRQETKSRNRRHVPIPAALREHLAAHRLRQAPGIDLVFGATSHRPFSPRR